MKISACMIAKNEEKNVERCINSYKDIVSEIIVVDTGSTDSTVEIAKKLGAKVYFFKWINNFAAAKNYALSKAKYDWIIFLDADEYFEKEAEKNIPVILQNINNNFQIDCINSTIENIERTTGKIIDVCVVTRIFRNRNIRYINKIHECIAKDRNKAAIPLKGYENKIKIKHTGYSSEIFKSKVERNHKLLLEELKKSKSNEQINMLYFYLTTSYGNLDDYDNAIKYAKLYIKSGKKVRNYITYIPYIMIGCMIKKGESYETLMKEINKYVKEYPDVQSFTCYAGIVNFNNKRYDLALYYFEKTILLRKSHNSSEYYQECVSNDNIFYYMAQIYYLKNDIPKSLEFCVRSLIENKNKDDSLRQLLILIRSQKPLEIVELLNSIYDKNNFNDIKYLITKLSFLKYGEVLLYYYNIWSNIFKQQDASVISTFLGMGRYDKAFDLLFNCFNEEKNDWDERLLVVSALFSENIENINKIKDIVSDTYKKIIDCYYNCDQYVSFNKSEINDFINLVNEFILIAGNNEKLEKIINIKYKFQFNISNLIGDMLVKCNFLELALEQYKDYINNQEYDDCAADIYFDAGVCSYKLNNYTDSLNFFESALKHGYVHYDLFEFVNWITKNSKDMHIIQKAKEILNHIEK